MDMKAIVLTYDRNAILTEHMVQCYNELWPNHPFIFVIPYQQNDRLVFSPQRKYIKTPKGIRDTVLTLLEDIDDEEWIYWCIDDKYPVQLHIQQIEGIYRSIKNNEMDNANGVLFCRARRMLQSDYLTGERILFKNLELLERKAYHQIWIHQFVKAGVIRYLFKKFPKNMSRAKIMDPLKDKINKPATHKLYVTSINYSIFGESSTNGIITRNCFESLKKYKFSIPFWFEINYQKSAFIGTL